MEAKKTMQQRFFFTVFLWLIERTYKSECERFIGDYARLANEYLEKGIINNGTRTINDMLKIASEYHIIYKKGAPKK